MNILKVLSHHSYGADKTCLLRIFNSLVKSRLDYGSVVYGSASKTALKMLDPVLHLGLRLASGAFRTSPMQSLYVECDQWCLEHQRSYTDIMYAVKTTSIQNHPASLLIKDTSAMHLFLNRPSISMPFPLRVKVQAEELGISFNDTYETSITDLVAPWEMSSVSCDLSFTEINKRNAPRELILQHFLHLQHKYPYTAFYTDASKSPSSVSCAAHGPNFTNTKTMNKNTSIFTAEAHGILTTVEYITQTRIDSSIIFTDSLSVVRALHSGKPTKNVILNRLIKSIMSAYALKLTLVVCWVPGHSGILGNEIADQNAAVAALRSAIDVPQVPYLDIKPLVRKGLRKCWQLQWDTQTDNKLHAIKPRIGRYNTEKRNRFTEISICRLRIGHTHATHSYLLNGTPPPVCEKCGERLSVLHVLIQCLACDDARKRHFPELYTYTIPLHPSLFLSDEPAITSQRVLAYLGDIGFLSLISYHA